MTGDVASGEDLCQSLFVEALRQEREHPGYLGNPAWPWLRMVAIRLATRQRHRLRRQLPARRWGQSEIGAQAHEVPSRGLIEGGGDGDVSAQAGAPTLLRCPVRGCQVLHVLLIVRDHFVHVRSSSRYLVLDPLQHDLKSFKISVEERDARHRVGSDRELSW